MPRRPTPCKRCDSTITGEHEPQCRYAKAHPLLAQAVAPQRATPKIRKRVFVIDHQDGETTVTVVGPAGAVRCSSTEQSVQVWTGESAPQPVGAQQQPVNRSPVVARSTDVSRSGEEYTITDALDDVPGGNMGLTEEEMADPGIVLERMRRGMIGRMTSETASSDVLLIPGEN